MFTCLPLLCWGDYPACFDSLQRAQRYKRQVCVYKHLVECDARNALSEEHNLDILCSTLRGEVHLEALWIRDIKPSMNVKDEYRSRELTIKF